jgi:hypothetical protein
MRARFIEPSRRWRMRDQALACERRSHSSKPMRPDARFAQWHERALLDPAAEVSRLGVTHDRTRVADRF